MSQQKTMEITKHLLAHDLEPLIREPIIAAAHRALSNNNGTYPEYREVQKALENDVSYSLVTISEVLLEWRKEQGIAGSVFLPFDTDDYIRLLEGEVGFLRRAIKALEEEQ